MPYIIYYEFYLGACTEKFDEDHSTAYLISRIRCNNIHIRILLHLILEIRYTIPYPCGLDVDVNTIGTNILRLSTLSKIPTKLEVECAKWAVCTGHWQQRHKESNTQTP